MSKKGVAKITGPTNPQIGIPASYSVTEWYKETPASQRNGNNVTWELFRKRNNGSYTSTNIKKKGATATFTFEEKALGQEFFVEGYLNSPEKKGNTIIYIKPRKGPPKIISLTLLDSNKNKITIKPKYGQTIVAEIKTQNMFKEKLLLQVWERDTTADTGHNRDENTLLYEKEITVNANGVNDENIVLTELMMKKAQGSGISFMIDGGEHEYYLVVKHNNISTFSPQTVQVLNQIIAVKGNGINPPPENPETATNVGQDPNQQNSEGKCPRCEEDFTWDEIKEIFGESDKTFRMDCVNWINKYKLDFGINTCAKKAHFLAQIAAETHFREKEMAEGNVKYIPRNIRSGTFGDRGKLLDKRGQIEEFCNERPDQKKLFSFLYAAENGFGNGNGNEASGDGFNFRGKGLIQLTGKGNYKSAMGLIKEYVPAKIYNELISSEKRIKHFDKFEFEENRKQKTIKDVDLFDFVTYYDMPTEPKYAVLSALADWKGKGLSNSALMVNDVNKVIDIRRKINVGVKNLKVAEEYFKKAIITLQLDSCSPPSKNNKQNKLQTYDGIYKATTKNAYIDVIVPSNRKKEGLLVFFDDTKVLHKCYVLGLGTGGEDRYTNGGYGNVPNGLWNTKLELDTPNTGVSFGNHGVIRLSPEAGDALKASSRSGILLHCGHTMGDGKKGLTDNGPLMVTHGCLRVYNADMPKITKIYSELTAKGKKIQIYIEEVSPEKIKDMFSFYGTVPDPKDANTNRKNKKDDAQ